MRLDVVERNSEWSTDLLAAVEREHQVYMAKLAEQAERYDGALSVFWLVLSRSLTRLSIHAMSRDGVVHEGASFELFSASTLMN